MKKKKPTKGDIERRLRDAIVLVPKDKEWKEIYFADRGLRLTITMDYTVVATFYHRHVFDNINANGFCRAALYVKKLIEIAYANDCTFKNEKGEVSYSYEKLLDTLKKKEDKSEYNIAMYVSWWLMNIFAPLYQLSDEPSMQFVLYYNYLNNISNQSIFLDEHKEGLTNKQFIEQHNKMMEELFANLQESQIFEPLSDEQRMQQEIEALQQQEAERNAQGD